MKISIEGNGVAIANWVAAEFQNVDLGDTRLNDRLINIVSTLSEKPNLSIPAACSGRAEQEATYRFFDNPNVDCDDVLRPHTEKTLQRAAEFDRVLFVQDTTELDLTRPEQIVIGAGELDGFRKGILLHEMIAFTTDAVPLGTVWRQIINRPELKHSNTKTREERRATPIEEKESFRWLEGLREARQAAQGLPATEVVCIADSEADIYELLSEPRGEKQVHWLIRAGQNRSIKCEVAEDERDGSEAKHLLEKVAESPVLYEVELKIRGRNAKVPASTRGRNQPRDDRKAKAEVRATKVTLRAPQRPDRDLPPVTVNVVLVREVNPPTGEEAVEWVLVTTLPIDTEEQVREIVRYYCIRWNIEVFFRVLKSGCRVEERRFEHVNRIERYLTVCLVVAWRTMFVCHMSRACPDLDCEVVFEPSEWKAVWATTKGTPLPKNPPRLREMVHMIAELGGYIERKGSEPGPQTMWTGMQRMYDLSWAWDRFGPESKFRAS